METINKIDNDTFEVVNTNNIKLSVINQQRQEIINNISLEKHEIDKKYAPTLKAIDDFIAKLK